MTTRNQHYVWRHYLRPWAQDEKIWCWRLGKLFNPNLMGIGQQRDFYKLEELTEEDIRLIKLLATEKTKNQELRKVNEAWIDTFQNVFRIKKLFSGLGVVSPEADKMFKELVIELEEKLHGLIESNAIPYINKILSDDLSLFNDEEEYMGFCHFLAIQYLRTNKIKENLAGGLDEIVPGFATRAIGVLRHIYSTNFAWKIFSDRQEFKPCLLINKSEVRFVAGDQPVINTYAAEAGYSEAVSDVEFYYPFSPVKAVIISKKEIYNGGSMEVTAAQVDVFNKLIVASSHEQVYAEKKDDLIPYVELLQENEGQEN